MLRPPPRSTLFPTRRSSDLSLAEAFPVQHLASPPPWRQPLKTNEAFARRLQSPEDRKSTRLNSSHVEISYAVFCLKKKNTTPARHHLSQQTNRPFQARLHQR